MTKRHLITQMRTKRITAAAIAEAKARRGWSNADAGDALGCGEGTIRNRLDGDDPHKQMTVYELLRSIQSDDGGIVNAILAEVDYRAAPIDFEHAVEVLDAALAATTCASQLIEADRDKKTTPTEARQLLPSIAGLQAKLGALEAQLRRIAEGGGG